MIFGAVFGQAAYYAWDTDTLIKVGLSTDLGYFGMELGDGRALTYGGAEGGGGGTVHLVFYIDGNLYTTDPYLPGTHPEVTAITPAASEYSEYDNLIITDWFPEDSVQFTQTLHPYSIDSAGAVTIRYNVINTDDVTHNIGVLLLIDTNINGRDDAPFYFPGGDHPIDSTYISPGVGLPDYFQIYEYGPFDTIHTDQIVARINLTTPPAIKPNWIAIGNQRTLADVVWDVSGIPDELITDGAVILEWGTVDVAPNGGVTFATIYGLAPGGEFIGGPLGARIEVPHSMRIQYCELTPNPIIFSTMFRNNTDSTMYSAICSLAFDDPALDVQPDTLLSLGDSILPAQMQSVSWQIYVPDSARPELSEYIYYTLHASAETLGEAGTLEVTETVVPGSIWVPGATYIGPTADISYPDSGTFTSNAIQPLAIYLIDDDTTVSPLSIHWQFLNAIGEVISDLHPGIAGITYEDDTLYWANTTHSDGSRMWYKLCPTYDYHGCPLQDTTVCIYTYDLSAPVIHGYYPPDDTILNDSLFDAYVYFKDNISRRIDTMLIRVTIADDEWTHTDSFPDGPLVWNPAEDTMLWIQPESSGWRWPDGDVTISLDRLCDAPDYGEPNCTDESELPEWLFTMNAHGPRAYPRTPDDGWFVAFPSPDIIFYLYDGNGINVSTVQYQVDGVVFGAPSDFHTGDSIIVHSPTVTWDNGYAVDIAVIAAEDTFGTPLDPPEYHYPAWEFVIDIAPPVINGTYPADGDTIGTEYPTIEVQLYDSLSGVNIDSITIEVDGILYTIDDDAVDFTGGVLSWDASIAGVSLDGDIEVCINACDSPVMGSSIWMTEYCFTFDALVQPPTVGFPFDGVSICSDDAQLDVYLYDRDSIDESSIIVGIDGVDYTTTDAELEYDAIYNVVTFYPSTPWLAGDYITICVDSAADMFGNALTAPVCSTFVVDLYPPEIDSVGEDIFSTWEPPDTAELDSVTFHFYFTDELGIIDSNYTSLFIYDSAGATLLWEFDYPDSSANLWFEDGEVVFWGGTAVDFVDFETYYICLFLDDMCYAGGHDADSALYCFDYYATDVREPQKLPQKPTMLMPNYPDPFNAATIIPVYMSERGYASIKIIDLTGRTISELWNGTMKSGITELRWNGTNFDGGDVPSGIYFVRLQTARGVQVSRACLIR